MVPRTKEEEECACAGPSLVILFLALLSSSFLVEAMKNQLCPHLAEARRRVASSLFPCPRRKLFLLLRRILSSFSSLFHAFFDVWRLIRSVCRERLGNFSEGLLDQVSILSQANSLSFLAFSAKRTAPDWSAIWRALLSSSSCVFL